MHDSSINLTKKLRNKQGKHSGYLNKKNNYYGPSFPLYRYSKCKTRHNYQNKSYSDDDFYVEALDDPKKKYSPPLNEKKELQKVREFSLTINKSEENKENNVNYSNQCDPEIRLENDDNKNYNTNEQGKISLEILNYNKVNSQQKSNEKSKTNSNILYMEKTNETTINKVRSEIDKELLPEIKDSEQTPSNKKESEDNNNTHFADDNIFMTPQSFKATPPSSCSPPNIPYKDIKEAGCFLPKRLSPIYDMYNTQPNNIQRSNSNTYGFMTTIQRPQVNLTNNFNFNCSPNVIRRNSSGCPSCNDINFLLNSNFMGYNHQNPPSVSPFHVFDQPTQLNNLGNINSLNTLNNMNNLNNLNNIRIPNHSIGNQSDITNFLIKTQVPDPYYGKENTDILEINVKVSEGKTLNFIIRRYDDMFRTIKVFCEINKLDPETYMRPLITHVIKALNSIYGIYNMKLKPEEIKFLKEIKENYYPEEPEQEQEQEQEEQQTEESDIKNEKIISCNYECDEDEEKVENERGDNNSGVNDIENVNKYS